MQVGFGLFFHSTLFCNLFLLQNITLFPNYNVVENRIILYEIMGYLTAYATYLFVYKREKALSKSSFKNSFISLYRLSKSKETIHKRV